MTPPGGADDELPFSLSRRALLAGGASCCGAAVLSRAAWAAPAQWYIGIIPDEPYDIRIVDILRIPEEFRRQSVTYGGPEPPGTLVVDRSRRHLYAVEGRGRAVRYGISVGREGAAWSGEAVIGRKAKWPTWTPTANMRSRDPTLPAQMAGGPQNPLGARALYLFRDGRDTLYRIHGTNQPSSIGKAASSGCIRMLNEHIFELYASVPLQARVVVR